MKYIMELRHVSYQYRTKGKINPILDDVSYSFKEGVLYVIMGRSGSGKTTTLSLLGALERPDIGEIFYDGKKIEEIGENNYRKNCIGMVFQSYNLLPYLTAWGNVEAAMEITRKHFSDKIERAEAALKKAGVAQELYHKKVTLLSGGEQQRVAIARAIAKDSKVILADEPTGNLDEDTGKEIITLFRELAHAENKCVIVVTHSREFAAAADVILTLKDAFFNVEK